MHFHGHGGYDRQIGLGALCFVDPKDAKKLQERAMETIHTGRGALPDYWVPVVFLEACQRAATEERPDALAAA